MHLTTRDQQGPTACARPAFGWLAASWLCGAATLLAVGPASALSEIGREELPPPAGTPGGSPEMPGSQVPGSAQPSNPPAEGAGEPGGAEAGQSDIARPNVDENGPLPEVVYNLDRLPEPVRRMRDRLVEAARTGDVEKLRPYLGLGNDTVQLSFGEVEGDPIAFLKGLSGDPEGQEILAILEEVLNAGFVHLDAGTPDEIYVWPYFFGLPLDKLDPRQRVELFKIVTAGDYEDMKQFGAYIFYRVGITPDGRWVFFVAGE